MARALLQYDQAPPPGALIPDDRPCMSCGYNIRGLAADSNCPECAAPLVLSLRGARLRYANPAYLRTLRRGALVTLWTIAILPVAPFVLWFIAGFVTVARAPRPRTPGVHHYTISSGSIGALVPAATALLLSAALLLGLWMLTAPDPARLAAEPARAPRRLARAAIAAAVLCGVGSLALSAVLPVAPIGLGFALNAGAPLAALLALIGAASHVRALAPRIPDGAAASAAGFTTTILWLALATAIGTIAIFAALAALTARAPGVSALLGLALIGMFIAAVPLGLAAYVLMIVTLSRFSAGIARAVAAHPIPPVAGTDASNLP